MTEKELYQKALTNIVGFTEEFGRWLYAHHIKLPSSAALATFSAKGLDDMLQTANTEQLERACARTLNSYWAARRWMIGKIGLGAANSVMDFTERDKKACQLGMVWLNGTPGGMPFRTIAGVKICGDEPTELTLPETPARPAGQLVAFPATEMSFSWLYHGITSGERAASY